MKNAAILLCMLLTATTFTATIAVHPPSNVRQACSVSEGAYYIQWSAPSGEEEPVTSYTVELSNGETVVTGSSQTELAVIRGGGGGGNLVFNATEVGGIGGRGNLVRNVSGVQTMFGFLKHFTVYSVRVRASYGRVMSDYSEMGYFRTPSYIPSQVAAPDVEIRGPSELRLTWTPPTYVNGPDLRYTIRVIPDLGGPQIDAVVTHTTETSIVLRDLCHGTHIGASVVPSSGFSSEITPGITPEVDMPLSNLAPTNVTTNVFGVDMFVRWDPPTEGVTRDLRYLVELSCSTESAFDDGLPCENPPRLDTPMTSGTVSGLLPGRKYLVRVMALRNGGRSAPTCAVATTGSGVPPPPSLVSVAVTSSTSVSITAESGFDAPIAVHVRINGSVQVFNNPLQPSVVSGLTPETTYQVEVAVESFDGIGQYSQPIIINTHNNNDLLNSVQNFQFHYPRGNDARSVYLSWDPPLTPAGILGYTVYINDQQISTGLDRFYEFSASPDTVYTASVCYRGASPCYRPSVILFELSQDFVDIINASAYRLSPNYTVEVVAINSSALYVFFSPPVNNCNGVEHLSQSGFITDLADVTPDILLPALAEGTQAYIQTGLNASTQYFFYAVKLRANYTKTISGQRLAGAMTMDGAPSGAQCPAEEVNGVSWPATSGNQNSIVSFEREGCPVVLLRYCSSNGQWGPVTEQLNPCSLRGAELVPTPDGSTTGSVSPTSGGPAVVPSSVTVLLTSLSACLLCLKALLF